MQSRAISVFEEYLDSQKTITQYKYMIQKFVKDNNLESFDTILGMNGLELTQKLEDYLIAFKEKGRSSSYIRLNTFAIQSFCEANNKQDVNWKKLRKLNACKKSKPKKTRPYTTSEVKRMLHCVKSLRNKSIILFLSSSGVRRGALPVLKVGNLKQMSLGCVAVTVYEGSDEEYVTFINKECNDMLTLYLEERKHNGEIITNDSSVFQLKNYSLKAISEASISNMLERTKINAGVNFEGTPNLLCHGLRRRFNTILKLRDGSNPTLIERLMGHDMKLDNSYFQPTLDQLFTEYKKGMADLTIDDAERLLVERKEVEKQISEFESQKLEQKSMQQEIEIIKNNQFKMNQIMTLVREGKVRIVDNNNEIVNLSLI